MELWKHDAIANRSIGHIVEINRVTISLESVSPRDVECGRF
jgi:hypothetical protein